MLPPSVPRAAVAFPNFPSASCVACSLVSGAGCVCRPLPAVLVLFATSRGFLAACCY